MNYHGLQGFTIDCRCTHSFYIIIMKCAQNLRFLVDQKPNNLKLLGAVPPDPLLQRSTIGLNPSPKTPYIYVYTSPNHCKKLARLDTGITDKFELEKSSSLKYVQNEFTKSYIHIGALFQNLALGPKSPLGSPVYNKMLCQELFLTGMICQ